MRNKIGNFCMALGILLLVLATGFLGRNQWEDTQAGKTAKEWFRKVNDHIEDSKTEILPDPYTESMTVEKIGGYFWIGCLTIPAIGIELPVMAEWDYDRLNISACRYSGSTKTDDLVIAAHNYRQHFGRLAELDTGEQVIFTDMDDETSVYRVASVEVLAAESVEEMISGEYALNLFTCTYDGKKRVTVHCERAI